MAIIKQKMNTKEVLHELEDMNLEFQSGSADSLKGELLIGSEKSLHKGEMYDQTEYYLQLEAVEIEDEMFLWYITIIAKNSIMGEYRVFEEETDNTVLIRRDSYGHRYKGSMPVDFAKEIQDILEHVEY